MTKKHVDDKIKLKLYLYLYDKSDQSDFAKRTRYELVKAYLEGEMEDKTNFETTMLATYEVRAAGLLKVCSEQDIKIIAFGEDAYPERAKENSFKHYTAGENGLETEKLPFMFLFVKGNADILKENKAVSVLGGTLPDSEKTLKTEVDEARKLALDKLAEREGYVVTTEVSNTDVVKDYLKKQGQVMMLTSDLSKQQNDKPLDNNACFISEHAPGVNLPSRFGNSAAFIANPLAKGLVVVQCAGNENNAQGISVCTPEFSSVISFKHGLVATFQFPGKNDNHLVSGNKINAKKSDSRYLTVQSNDPSSFDTFIKYFNVGSVPKAVRKKKEAGSEPKLPKTTLLSYFSSSVNTGTGKRKERYTDEEQESNDERIAKRSR